MLARFRARGDVRRRAACAGRGPQGELPSAGLFAFRARTASGPCAFAAPSAAHRRRAFAASSGKPSKGPCARGPVRLRTTVYHAPAGPQRGCSLAGPSSVLGRSRCRERRCARPRRPFAPLAPCLAGLLTACAAVLCGAPLRAFLPQRGVSNLTVVARPALSRRSAVSKRFCTGRPPLWCWRYVPRVSEVRGVYAPSILLCLCCYWLVWSVLRLSLSVLHFLVNVFDS